MSKVVRVKAKVRKDPDIELYFVGAISGLNDHEIKSSDYSSTIDMAIISHLTNTYKSVDIEARSDNEKYHTFITCYSKYPIYSVLLYKLVTSKSNVSFSEKYYHLIHDNDYEISVEVVELDTLARKYGISISYKYDTQSNKNNFVKSTSDTNNQMNKSSFETDIDFTGIDYTSVSTSYDNNIVTIEGSIYNTVKARYISIILDAAIRALNVSPENIYLLDVQYLHVKQNTSDENITQYIKEFIESQGIFANSESVFIPFYVDTNSRKVVERLKKANFQGVWSLYMYTGDMNSAKVFEELLRLENAKG